mgnify:CR=1 FL=1
MLDEDGGVMIRVLLPLTVANEIVLPLTNEKINLSYYQDEDDYKQKILDDFWDVVYGPKVEKQPEAIFVESVLALSLAIRFVETKKALEKCRRVNDIMHSYVELQGVKILPTLRQLQRMMKSNNITKLVIVVEKGVKTEAYIDFLSEGKFIETSTGNYEAVIDGKKISIIESSTHMEENMNIKIPPLRERKEDIPYMIDHLLSSLHHRYKNLPIHFPDEQTLRIFMLYDWPGNTEELIETVYAYASGRDDIVNRLLARNILATDTEQIDLKGYVDSIIAKVEKQFISDTLQKTSWNRKKASSILKMNYKTFCYKMKKYGINRH